MATYGRKFESLTDFVKFADGDSAMKDYRASRDEACSSGWCPSTYKETLRLVAEGWPEGLARMADLTEKITSVVGQKINRPEYEWDVAGEDVDVGRFLSGEPENMITYQETPVDGVSGKIIKLRMNVAALGGVQAETIFNRGAAVISLVAAMERVGYSFEIVVVAASRDFARANIILHEIMLKEAGDIVDMDKLAFVMANASFFRRLVFSARECEPANVRKIFDIGGGYGSTIDDWKSGVENGIDVPGLRSNEFSTIEGACRWVLEKAKAIMGDAVAC
jgi:hypothetical protein